MYLKTNPEDKTAEIIKEDFYREQFDRYLMKDGNTTRDEESQQIKWNRGLDLFIESILKPDQELRQCAHNQKCYTELMDIRDNILQHLKSLRWE